MFDQLFEVLGTYESNLAEKTKESKSPRFNKALLTSGTNQITTLMQNPTTLPKGSRTMLQKLYRVMSDCLKGLNTGTLSYPELRAAARDLIGREHAKLKRLAEAEAAKGKEKELEFEDDDAEPMVASSVVKAKRRVLELALGKKFLKERNNKGELEGKSMNGDTFIMINKRLHHVMDQMEAQMVRMSDADVKKIDIEKLVSTHTLEELAHMTGDELKATDGESDELKALMASYKHIMNRLPAKLHNAFQAFEFPVVPLFESLKKASGPDRQKFINLMAQKGVKVKWIGDHFPIFEKQYLLALDCGRLGIPKTLSKTKARGKKSVNSKDDNGPDTIVGGVLDTINKVSPVQYVPASTQLISNPRNSEIKLMWIVSEEVRLAISRHLHTSEVTWGLPAEIE